jgi:glutamyl-tRNA synthetase
MKDVILKYCLQNAVFYKGKANPGAVMGKVMAEVPDARKDAAGVRKLIEETVREVNKLSPEEQARRLEEIDPKLMHREVKKQEELPDIPGAVMGKIVTRFAPAPSGPLNIGHILRAVMLSYMYAKKYRGKFLLRFEDTDARLIKKEYYEWIKEDLKNVGVAYDRVSRESEHMDVFYKHAVELIRGGHMYVCTCSSETFGKFKDAKEDCPCRTKKPQQNLSEWQGMLGTKYKEGDAVLRFKTSMKEPNPALRDHACFRISVTEHPYVGKRYRVWPLYNFANAIEDHYGGITHVFRGKEHEHNTEIQKRIYSVLKWKPPVFVNFGMVYLPGEKLHKRDVKEKIKNGEYDGWDDVRLHTVRALMRRGFQPQAFRGAAITCGLTKNDIRFDWNILESANRKIIDPIANRYMVVEDPIKISVRNAPKVRSAFEPLHIDFPKRGKKRVPVNTKGIYISKADAKNLNRKEFRLKGLFNVRLGGNIAVYTGNEVLKEMPKIQWVSSENVEVMILMPDGSVVHGIAEPAIKDLAVGSVLQMERIGFGRVDRKTKKGLLIAFAHR